MWKSEKLRVLSALVALGGALLFDGLGHAASDTFECRDEAVHTPRRDRGHNDESKYRLDTANGP